MHNEGFSTNTVGLTNIHHHDFLFIMRIKRKIKFEYIVTDV